MKTSDINLAKKQALLCNKWHTILSKALLQLNTYINSFNQNDFLSFSLTNAKAKTLKKEYFNFMCEFEKSFSQSADCASELASMVSEADIQMNTEKTAELALLFESYTTIEKELYRFTSSTEEALAKNSLTPALALASAKKLKLSIELFIQKLISKA